MKVKTSELQGAALDWAVAKCEYPELTWGKTIGLSAHARNLIVIPQFKEPECWWTPTTNWGIGGPLLEREKISVGYERYGSPNGEMWDAVKKVSEDAGFLLEFGSTPLEAAMRCYVASKLGEEVDVPIELTQLGETK